MLVLKIEVVVDEDGRPHVTVEGTNKVDAGVQADAYRCVIGAVRAAVGSMAEHITNSYGEALGAMFLERALAEPKGTLVSARVASVRKDGLANG